MDWIAHSVVKFLGCAPSCGWLHRFEARKGFADRALPYDRVVSDVENKRGDDRVKVDAFVKVSGESDREYVFRTRDLSAKGLFLYTKVTHIYPIEVGDRLTLELYDYEDAIVCTVVVARVVEPSSDESEDFPTGFGVKVSEITEENSARLDALIGRIQEGHAPY
jgi:hypothetical protein